MQRTFAGLVMPMVRVLPVMVRVMVPRVMPVVDGAAGVAVGEGAAGDVVLDAVAGDVDGEGAVGFGSGCGSARGGSLGGAGRGPSLAEGLAVFAGRFARHFWQCLLSPVLGRLLVNPAGGSWVPLPVFPRW